MRKKLTQFFLKMKCPKKIQIKIFFVPNEVVSAYYTLNFHTYL